jgi:hypothetical protein
MSRPVHVPAPHTKLVVVTATAPPREQLIPVRMHSPRVTMLAPQLVPSVVRAHGSLVVVAMHEPPSHRKLVDSLAPMVEQTSENAHVPTVGAGQSASVAHVPQALAASSHEGQVSRPLPQLPPLHTSPLVQKRPSSHPTTFGMWSHPALPQRSSVHGLPSLHAVGSQLEPSGGRPASSSAGTSRSMMGLR